MLFKTKKVTLPPTSRPTRSPIDRLFEPGKLYKIKADIPVYIFSSGGSDSSSSSCFLVKKSKVTIPGEEVVMCLAIESFPDRRRIKRTTTTSSSSSSSSIKDISDSSVYNREQENSIVTLIDYSPEKNISLVAKKNNRKTPPLPTSLTPSRRKKEQELENLVYEVMFLWKERRHVVVCMGYSSLKLIKNLFFTNLVEEKKILRSTTRRTQRLS